MGDEPAGDPFEVLGVKRRFELDKAAVERAYLARAASVHPDGNASDGRGMAELNDARRVLLDGESRARALLALEGLSDPEDRALPDGFLESMLETRMEIEAAVASGDEAERARWGDWADERRREHLARVGELFASLEGEGADRDAIGAAVRLELNAWRYIERLIEQLDPAYNPERADFQ